MGWSSYQNVVPPPLSQGVCGHVVPTHNSSCCYVSNDLVDFCHIDSYSRVSASRILLAASVTATLYRLTEVLLGKRHIKPPSRRCHPVFAYPYDMEITDVDEKQNLFDRYLRTWRLVSF